MSEQGAGRLSESEIAALRRLSVGAYDDRDQDILVSLGRRYAPIPHSYVRALLAHLDAVEAELRAAREAEGRLAGEIRQQVLEEINLVGASYYHDDHDQASAEAVWRASAVVVQAGTEPYDTWIAKQREAHEQRVAETAAALAEPETQ